MRSLVQELGARVKERALGQSTPAVELYRPVKLKAVIVCWLWLAIQPTGFKYIVTVHLNENLGQGGRAGLSSHWEESDQSLTEVWSNVSADPAIPIRSHSLDV